MANTKTKVSTIERKVHFTRLEVLANGVAAEKSDILNEKKFERICSSSDKRSVVIKLTTSQSPDKIFGEILTKEQGEILLERKERLKNECGRKMFFYGGITIEEAIDASEKFRASVRRIQNATVEGRPLSVMEKVLFVYKIASSYQYKDNINPAVARSLLGVLSTNKAVCVGHANVFSAFCNALKIPCATQEVLIQNENGAYDLDGMNHENCRVLIHDPVYNCSGVYICDPCWDSSPKGSSIGYDYALMTKVQSNQMINGEDGIDFNNGKLAQILLKQKLTHAPLAMVEEFLDKKEVGAVVIKKEVLSNAVKNIYVSMGQSEEAARSQAFKEVGCSERFTTLGFVDIEEGLSG